MRPQVALMLTLILANSAASADPARTLTLEDVRALAARSSPAVRSAALQAEAARQRYAAARAASGPQASAAAVGTASNTDSMLSPPAMIEPDLMQMMPDEGGYAASAGVAVPLFTGGRLQALAASASRMLVAEEASAQAARIEAVRLAETAFHRLVYTGEMVRAAETEVSEQQEQARLASDLAQTGKAPEFYVARAESELARAQKALLLAKAELAAASAELAAALGESASPEVIAAPTGLQELPALEAMETDLDKSPVLLSRRSSAEAAAESAREARAAFSPQIYALARLDARSANDSDAMFGSGYTVGIAASLPLFDGGIRRARVRESEALQESASAAAEQERLRLLGDLRAGHARASALSAGVALSQKTLESAKLNYEVALARYQAGRGIQVEVLDALSNLAEARREVAESLYQANSAITAVKATAGAL